MNRNKFSWWITIFKALLQRNSPVNLYWCIADGSWIRECHENKRVVVYLTFWNFDFHPWSRLMLPAFRCSSILLNRLFGGVHLISQILSHFLELFRCMRVSQHINILFWPTTAQRYLGNRRRYFSGTFLLSSVKKISPPGNLKKYLGIFQSLQLRIPMENILLLISLKLNFAPNRAVMG